MKYYMGIDGGGTKTKAVVCDEKGNILCRAEGKTINFYAVGMEKARENLSELVEEIKKYIGAEELYSVFIGCSALDGEADEKTVEALCRGVVKSSKIAMNSDLYVAIHSADAQAVAVCGTGSMAIGKKGEKIITKGGWGHILGDEGSAYAIALDALKTCCISYDKGEENALIKSACEYFEVADFRGVIDKIYSHATGKDYIAGFCVAVNEASESGNEVATAIIRNQAERFGETVISLVSHMGECERLCVYGGVFAGSRLFFNAFSECVKRKYPSTEIQKLLTPPEEGALKLARKLK